MKSGALTFALLEVAGIAYALLLGRLPLTQKTAEIGLRLVVAMAVVGLVFGFVFTFIRGAMMGIGPYAQGVIAMVGAYVCSMLASSAENRTFELIVGLTMSAVGGIFFVWNAQRLAPNQNTTLSSPGVDSRGEAT